jgi:hypothetical protein
VGLGRTQFFARHFFVSSGCGKFAQENVSNQFTSRGEPEQEHRPGRKWIAVFGSDREKVAGGEK